MNKWVKIEEFINKVLSKLQILLLAFGKWLWVTFAPTKLKQLANGGHKVKTEPKSGFNQKIKASSQKLKQRLIESAAQLQGQAKQKRQVVVEKVSTLKTKAKNLNIKELKGSDYKKLAQNLEKFWLPLWLKVKVRIDNLRPQTIVMIFLIASVFITAALGIYNNAQRIKQRGQGKREIASEVEPVTRPKYFRAYEKHFNIYEFAVPSYTMEKKPVFRKLMVDFTVVSSNRYIRSYFIENEDLLYDKLYSQMEPIELSFPVDTAEGKLIIKNKLKEEINKLLEQEEVKGQIDDIHIVSILGA